MAFPTIQDLLESGVHFGHQTRRWNPKMKKFIFAERNGIHIIDLKKTLDHLKRAADTVRDIASQGGNILFVGTKKQLKDIIRDEAERCGMYYVNERWLGGMMTNFQTIKKNIRRLRELERMRDEGEFEFRTKKEALSLERELEKLKKTLEGIKLLGDIPSAMFVVDAQKEKIAVAEANKLGIPLIALIDTNADPEKISFPVAGNDDAIRSVKVITEAIANAVLDGKSEFDQKAAAKEAEKQQEQQEKSGSDARAGEQGRRPRPRRRTRKKKTVGEGGAPPSRKDTTEQAKASPAEGRSATASKQSSARASEKSGKAKAAPKKAESGSKQDRPAEKKKAADSKKSSSASRSAAAKKSDGGKDQAAKKPASRGAKTAKTAKKSTAKSTSASRTRKKTEEKKSESK